MDEYRIILKSIRGEEIGELHSFNSLRFKTVLNKEGDASFSLSIKDPKTRLIDPLLTEMYIYKNNDIKWGGIIVKESFTVTGGADTITYNAFGFLWYTKWWQVTGLYSVTKVQQTHIPWLLIALFQSKPYGHRGIVKGFLPNSVVRESKQFENKSVYECIQDMTSLDNGFDVEINQTKVFNAFYPGKGIGKGTPKLFDKKNIASIAGSRDGSDPLNTAYVMGDGYGDTMATATIEDMQLMQEYGMYHNIVSYKSTGDLSFLRERGREEILKKGIPKREYSLSQIPRTLPALGDVEVGEYAQIDYQYHNKHINDRVRIKEITTSFNDGVEKIDYGFTNE